MKSKKDIQDLLVSFGECLIHSKDIGNEKASQAFSRSIDVLLWVLGDEHLDQKTKELFDALSSKGNKTIKDFTEDVKRKMEQDQKETKPEVKQEFKPKRNFNWVAPFSSN